MNFVRLLSAIIYLLLYDSLAFAQSTLHLNLKYSVVAYLRSLNYIQFSNNVNVPATRVLYTPPLREDPNSDYLVIAGNTDEIINQSNDDAGVPISFIEPENDRPSPNPDDLPITSSPNLMDAGPSSEAPLHSININPDRLLGLALFYGSNESPSGRVYNGTLGAGLRIRRRITTEELSFGFRLYSNSFDRFFGDFANNPLQSLLTINSGTVYTSTTNIRILELPRGVMSLFIRQQIDQSGRGDDIGGIRGSSINYVGLIGVRVDGRR